MNLRTTLRRLRNTIRQRHPESIFFLHIPKCGGTSLRHAMSEGYRTLGKKGNSSVVHLKAAPKFEAAQLLEASDSQLEVARLDEFLLLYFMQQKQTKFIDGHIPFPYVAYRHFNDRFRFVTLLRDPVDRWISEYTYIRFHGGEFMRHVANNSLEGYLESSFGIGQGRQYVLYLGGRREDNSYRSQEAIDIALRNIQKFELIGCIEEIEIFSEAFLARFGQRLSMPSLNRNPSPSDFVETTFTPAIRERIREICAPDYAIYEHVKENPPS